MAKLYTPELLSLSTRLADFPYLESADATAEVRSRTCGSTLAMSVRLDADKSINSVGMRVSACAVGQSAAAIFGAAAQGVDLEQLKMALKEIDVWLEGETPLPRWPGFAPLEPAKDHKGRHDAMRLPWRAGISALSSAQSAG